jgi:hypothetical protein
MTDNLQPMPTTESAARQPYTKPALVHELKLETRAGSTPALPGLTDPLGIDPTKPQGN